MKEVEAYGRELEAIKVQLRERDEAHNREVEAHDKEVEAYKREVEAIKGQMEQMDQRLKEKDQRLAKAENESSDIVTALVNVAKRDRMTHQKRGE
jgi:chromosome segregation ATPase